MKNLVLKLSEIQRSLKAPKNQRNNFGGYNYRSCEDILEAVKPLLNGLILTISDDIVEVGGRVYVKATAKISDGVNIIENSAFAREAEARKGMDDSQVTGATSSYARKYALNGLLCIDDTKDADATNTHDRDIKPQPKTQQSKTVTPVMQEDNFEERFIDAYKRLKTGGVRFSPKLEESFKSLMAEAEKRKYDDSKQEEMWEIFNSLSRDSLPTFTTTGA